MSGGVDSSVAAYLLQKQGYDVIGLTFRNWPQSGCVSQAVTDARMVADSLGIPHHVVDEIDTFQQEVINYFVAEYKNGRTPNPCVVCNEKIKFGSLLKKAQALGADFIATGHYARIQAAPVSGRDGSASRPSSSNDAALSERAPYHEERAPYQGNGVVRYQLRKGRDSVKDQSYFLFRLRQDQLARARMPLGDLSKEETRAIARKMGLKTAEKAESQEICFVPDKDYGRFLREIAKLPDNKGEIATRDGNVLGLHNGIQYFTVGQREGLKLGGQSTPLYVVELDAAHNRVIVGPSDELLRSEFQVADCSWSTDEGPTSPLDVTVKIRSNSECYPATVVALSQSKGLLRRTQDGVCRVVLSKPQRSITPGQAAVFYQDDLVLGGGWIC